MIHAMRARPRAEHTREGQGEHPDWCDRARCHAGVVRLGEHRSEPIRATAFRTAGHVVGTRVLTAGGAHWLELSINLRLPAGPEARRARYAHQVLTALTTAMSRAWCRRGATHDLD